MTDDTLRMILDKNPGLLSILFTGVFLPLGILWMTNRYNRKMRDSEKSIDLKNNSKEDLRGQKKMIYSSLSQILFNIQKLNADLSEPCIDSDCLSDAVSRFEQSVSSYHGVISNNMLYLSSSVINLIYKFYRQINEMKTELKLINKSKEFDMANVSVFYFSQALADTLIEIQEIFIQERSDLKLQFNKKQQEMMKLFCGMPPSEIFIKKYNLLKQSLTTK